ncbi:MAG: chemotaxis protein CheX [Fibromonadaceae bacterium]|jgi:chemotaxis protein CheX|nr:chemotaxis protein CheX [Fibromonadaceae bacterium]
MKAEWINAFILATRDTFSKMLKLNVEAGKPYILSEEVNIKDISGMIGLSGTIKGAVVIGFPEQGAINTANIFLCEKFTQLGPDISDAVGELVNIIAGYVKKFIQNERFGISLPSIARGPKHMVYMPKYAAPTIVIPFSCPEVGAFVLEAALTEGHDG